MIKATLETTEINAELETQVINATFSDAIVIRQIDPSEIPETRYETTFTEGDLSIAGTLVKQHNLGKIPNALIVFDPTGKSIGIQEIEVLTENAIAIPMNDFMPLESGIWKLIIGV